MCQKEKSRDDDAHAKQARLFAPNGQDRIRMRQRHPAVLAAPDADPLEFLEAVFPVLVDQQRFVALAQWQRDLAERLASLRGAARPRTTSTKSSTSTKSGSRSTTATGSPPAAGIQRLRPAKGSRGKSRKPRAAGSPCRVMYLDRAISASLAVSHGVQGRSPCRSARCPRPQLVSFMLRRRRRRNMKTNKVVL